MWVGMLLKKKTLDLEDLLAHVDDPSLIEGIYNYCNRRCDRCPFTARCHLFRDLREVARTHPDRKPLERVHDGFQRTFDLLEAWCEREGIDFDQLRLDAHSEEVAAERRRIDETRQDPLVKLAESYTLAALKLIERLERSAPFHTRPPDVHESVETITIYAIAVASKIHRALSGVGRGDNEFEESPTQNDWNGSAKVARLLVAESRAAWETLLDVGRAAADSPLRRMVSLLDEIDAGVSERFPRAMEFVRPGFDER